MRKIQTMIRTSRFRSLSAGVALAFLAGPAFALDGADLMTKLNAAYATSGVTIGYSDVRVDGSTVTLEGAELKTTGAESPAKIGTIAMKGVEEDGTGGYRIETVSFDDIDLTAEGTTFRASDLALSGVTIPSDAEAAAGTLDSVLMYESASAGPISVAKGGKELFSMSGAKADIARMDNDAGLTFDAVARDLKADLTEVEDPQTRAALDTMGIRSLNGEITMSGSWELASGKFSFDEYAIDFVDLGRLDLSLEFSGYTLEFLKGMQDALKAVENNDDKDQANAALGMSMMGLIQQLTFNSASISFNDASLTRKLLDYAGSQQGVSGDQMAQSLKGLVPIMIAQLNLPELQNQISEAVTTYLDDPKSLTISARPAKPVPFPMIMGAAMGAPNTIPQVLGVTVSAND